MPSEQDRRAAILVALRANRAPQRNYRVPKTTVYRLQRLESKGNANTLEEDSRPAQKK
ncbi:Hypothetical protein FKW44_004028 [Caligus rogercresseyi]|uniref:Uncharacterized protein n=1 Tax=Caligus rogercresseyi TaxID=217165 RepID=A0A7T8HL23_CALRO|nr:Hypothetical protein FKW44_004028 [Caligus rogercresseyi]